MKPDRPPILTDRGFDRRLATMIAVAFGAHAVILTLVFLVGKFQIRPPVENEAYTVSVIDGGELGGHLPAGLPDVNIGPSAAKRLKPIPARKPPAEKPAPEPPRPEPPPQAAEPPPPPPPPKPEPPPRAHEEPPPPVEVAKSEPEDNDPNRMVIPASPTPVRTPVPTAPPTARPTAKPTAAPTARPTPRPTARPTPTPTRRPETTPTPHGAAAKPSPTAGRPTPTPTRATSAVAAAPQPSPTAGAHGKPTATPVPGSREAQIAEALARVQARVKDGKEPAGHEAPAAGERGATSGSATGAPTGAANAPGGGVGGTDAPDPRRGIGIGPGAGGAGKVRGVEFLLYYNQMLSRIRQAWVWAGSATNLQVRVHFRVADDGAIVDLRVVEPSGDGSYDASVLRAVRGVSPLAPPPAQYRSDFQDVELTFQPSDLKQPG